LKNGSKEGFVMRLNKRSLPLVCLLFYLAAAVSAYGQAFPEQDFVLTTHQVRELTIEALDGSGPAALRLSRFYSNVAINLDEALKWALIGAENGDANCQYTAYAFLDKRMVSDDRRRALFWLKKAADQGYGPAIEHIHNGR
jgi:TPR repeat protein